MSQNAINIKKNDIIIKEGDPSTHLYLLVKGELEVLKKMKNQKVSVQVNIIEEGQLVGEIAFIDQKPRSATVRATKDSVLYEIDYPTYSDLIKGQPIWIRKMMMTLTNKVRKLSEI